MFSKECEYCHEMVFIRKPWNGLNLCLDCLDAVKFGYIKLANEKDRGIQIENRMQEDLRRCTNCGRVIPEDARICPYCRKQYW